MPATSLSPIARPSSSSSCFRVARKSICRSRSVARSPASFPGPYWRFTRRLSRHSGRSTRKRRRKPRVCRVLQRVRSPRFSGPSTSRKSHSGHRNADALLSPANELRLRSSAPSRGRQKLRANGNVATFHFSGLKSETDSQPDDFVSDRLERLQSEKNESLELLAWKSCRERGFPLVVDQARQFFSNSSRLTPPDQSPAVVLMVENLEGEQFGMFSIQVRQRV